MAVIRFEASGWTARVDDGYDKNSVVRIASAIGSLWASRYMGSTILVGYDSRRDSERLAVVAGQVLSAAGFEVIVSDRVCPTPALSWSPASAPFTPWIGKEQSDALRRDGWRKLARRRQSIKELELG